MANFHVKVGNLWFLKRWDFSTKKIERILHSACYESFRREPGWQFTARPTFEIWSIMIYPLYAPSETSNTTWDIMVIDSYKSNFIVQILNCLYRRDRFLQKSSFRSSFCDLASENIWWSNLEPQPNSRGIGGSLCLFLKLLSNQCRARRKTPIRFPRERFVECT